jgi:hypothetical protein
LPKKRDPGGLPPNGEKGRGAPGLPKAPARNGGVPKAWRVRGPNAPALPPICRFPGTTRRPRFCGAGRRPAFCGWSGRFAIAGGRGAARWTPRLAGCFSCLVWAVAGLEATMPMATSPTTSSPVAVHDGACTAFPRVTMTTLWYHPQCGQIEIYTVFQCAERPRLAIFLPAGKQPESADCSAAISPRRRVPECRRWS